MRAQGLWRKTYLPASFIGSWAYRLDYPKVVSVLLYTG